MRYLLLLLIILGQKTVANDKATSRAVDHAPIGVMFDHYHKKGEWMISARQSHMEMTNNIFNGNAVSVADVLEMPNPLSIQPANLSIVPAKMGMQMTMVGVMFAPTNKITLMAMINYISKDMNLNTHQEIMSRDLIGSFSTSTSDVSDMTISTLIKLKEDDKSRWSGEISLQKSLSQKDIEGNVLTPMGQTMEMVLPYAMQTGDGASRFTFGITNIRKITDNLIWGNQVRTKAVIDEDAWAFGNQYSVTTWLQYEVSRQFSVSTRLKFDHENKILGRNLSVVAPVQTANTENYGGKELQLGLGANLLAKLLHGKNDRLGLELLIPLQQNKNNLQMATDYKIIFGCQKAI